MREALGLDDVGTGARSESQPALPADLELEIPLDVDRLVLGRVGAGLTPAVTRTVETTAHRASVTSAASPAQKAALWQLDCQLRMEYVVGVQPCLQCLQTLVVSLRFVVLSSDDRVADVCAAIRSPEDPHLLIGAVLRIDESLHLFLKPLSIRFVAIFVEQIEYETEDVVSMRD